MKKAADNLSVIATFRPTGEEFGIGSPGMTVFSSGIHRGKTPRDFSGEQIVFAIEVDLPFLTGLSDDWYEFNVEGRRVDVCHSTLRRGEEEWSTTATADLPRFSHLQISGKGWLDRFEGSKGPPMAVVQAMKHGPEAGSKIWESYRLISGVTDRIRDLVSLRTGEVIFADLPPLSYRIDFFLKGQGSRGAVAQSLFPYTGVIEARATRSTNPQVGTTPDDREFLRQAIQVSEFFRQRSEDSADGGAFRQRVRELIHDFCFYGRQHPKALQSLDEERVRDLLLVAVKIALKGAGEAEVFNFDGRTDLKVTNSEARHEFVMGELKWWRGDRTFEEVLHQAFRKHATGQESEIHILVLCSNRDHHAVFDRALDLAAKDPDIATPLKRLDSPFLGSKELVARGSARVRGELIDVVLFLACLYHEKQ